MYVHIHINAYTYIHMYVHGYTHTKFMIQLFICTAGMDYTVTASVFNVTISAGTTSSSFNIDIIDDVTHEDTEIFNIAIRLFPSCLSLSLGISSSAVMIIDSDGM